MNRKIQRAMARKPAPPTMPETPVSLIATIRKSRTGYTAVIDAMNPADGTIREIAGTCSASEMADVIGKAYDVMATEMDEPKVVKLLVEGVRSHA